MGFLSSIFGVREAQATGDALDSQLAELNRRDYAPGGRLYAAVAVTDPAQAEANWRVVQRQMDSGDTGNVETQLAGAAAAAPLQWFYDPLEAWQDTQEGAGLVVEAADEVLPKVGNAFSWLGNSFLKLIPWWAWLALAGVIAWKLGLFDIARRRIAKA